MQQPAPNTCLLGQVEKKKAVGIIVVPTAKLSRVTF